ncbi:cadherin-related family member 5 [Amia ocellicauda]|uniref:cadherin-related family member 5 n=1 Tax=Amia ocellicauda TaxID=2972642 RepID=UPI00346460FF
MRLLLVVSVLAGAAWRHSAGKITNTSAASGREFYFSCFARGREISWEWEPRYPRCAGVEGNWQRIYSIDRRGNHTVESHRFRSRLRVNSYNILVLKDIVMSDAGLYSCSDIVGYKDYINLHVTQGCYKNLRLTPSNQSVSPRVGESFSVLCSHCDSTEPPATGFDWSLNGQPINGDSEGFMVGDKTLTIQRVDESHEGRVTCGSGGLRAELCLTVDNTSLGTSATPPPGDHTPATPPHGDHTSITPPPGDPTSATPLKADQTSTTHPPGDHTSATHPHGDHSSATPPPGDQTSASPSPGDPTSATPLKADQTSTTHPPGDHTSVTPPHGDQTSATPSPGDPISATPPNGDQISPLVQINGSPAFTQLYIVCILAAMILAVVV